MFDDSDPWNPVAIATIGAPFNIEGPSYKTMPYSYKKRPLRRGANRYRQGDCRLLLTALDGGLNKFSARSGTEITYAIGATFLTLAINREEICICIILYNLAVIAG